MKCKYNNIGAIISMTMIGCTSADTVDSAHIKSFGKELSNIKGDDYESDCQKFNLMNNYGSDYESTCVNDITRQTIDASLEIFRKMGSNLDKILPMMKTSPQSQRFKHLVEFTKVNSKIYGNGALISNGANGLNVELIKDNQGKLFPDKFNFDGSDYFVEIKRNGDNLSLFLRNDTLNRSINIEFDNDNNFVNPQLKDEDVKFILDAFRDITTNKTRVEKYTRTTGYLSNCNWMLVFLDAIANNDKCSFIYVDEDYLDTSFYSSDRMFEHVVCNKERFETFVEKFKKKAKSCNEKVTKSGGKAKEVFFTKMRMQKADGYINKSDNEKSEIKNDVQRFLQNIEEKGIPSSLLGSEDGIGLERFGKICESLLSLHEVLVCYIPTLNQVFIMDSADYSDSRYKNIIDKEVVMFASQYGREQDSDTCNTCASLGGFVLSDFVNTNNNESGLNSIVEFLRSQNVEYLGALKEHYKKLNIDFLLLERK